MSPIQHSLWGTGPYILKYTTYWNENWQEYDWNAYIVIMLCVGKKSPTLGSVESLGPSTYAPAVVD